MSTAAARMKYPKIRNFYNGEFVDSTGVESLEVTSPIDGNLLSQVPMSTADELNAAVDQQKRHLQAGATLRSKERVQVFFEYRQLLEANFDELTASGFRRNWQDLGRSKGRGRESIELTEFACSMPQLVQARF
jgi:malonate-semialdehyde dehydrogenase (acetylating)/methylmalonate-semialdehyde dehydrogenase